MAAYAHTILHPPLSGNAGSGHRLHRGCAGTAGRRAAAGALLLALAGAAADAQAAGAQRTAQTQPQAGSSADAQTDTQADTQIVTRTVARAGSERTREQPAAEGSGSGSGSGSGEQGSADTADGAEQPNWIDNSHAYVTDTAQAMTQWMDRFFGDETYNLEQAESLLRLQIIDDWNHQDGHDYKARLRGKLQLPRISRRLDLVFSDVDDIGDDLPDNQREDRFGLLYRLRESERSRFDGTLGFANGMLKPGIRYRNQGPTNEALSYRFIQRLEWERGEDLYATTQLDLNYLLDENNVWRWTQRAVYGQRTEGVEWRSRLALRQRRRADSERPVALEYYASLDAVTEPSHYVRNYRLGLIWRRKVYREYLFMELEPNFNMRRETADAGLDTAWGLILRLEFVLERDLARRTAAQQQASAAEDDSG